MAQGSKAREKSYSLFRGQGVLFWLHAFSFDFGDVLLPLTSFTVCQAREDCLLAAT